MQVDPAEADKRKLEIDFVFVEPSDKQLDILAGMFNDKKLKTSVQKIYPLQEAARAQEASKEGHVKGKLVLAM